MRERDSLSETLEEKDSLTLRKDPLLKRKRLSLRARARRQAQKHLALEGSTGDLRAELEVRALDFDRQASGFANITPDFTNDFTSDFTETAPTPAVASRLPPRAPPGGGAGAAARRRGGGARGGRGAAGRG